MSKKYCIVPMCKSTNKKTPNKLFFFVPRNDKIRKMWCQVMRRDQVSHKSCLYCCEDHFDIKEDTENFIEYETMGMMGKSVMLRLKKGILPHKFDCQGNKIPTRRPRLLKRLRLDRLDVIEKPLKTLKLSTYQSAILEANVNIFEPPESQWEICLTCLKKNDTMVSINQNVEGYENITPFNLLQEFNFINTEISNTSSDMICEPCLTKLRSYHEFKLQCEESNKFWEKCPSKEDASKLIETSSNQTHQDLTIPAESSISEDIFDSSKKIKLEDESVALPDLNSNNSENSDVTVKLEIEEFSVKEEVDSYHSDSENSFNETSATIDNVSQTESNNQEVPITKIICTMCKLKFIQNSQFLNHIKAKHFPDGNIEIILFEEHCGEKISEKMIFYCGICSLCSYNDVVFKSHLETHPEYSLIKCSVCCEDTNNLVDFFNHYITHYQ